MTSKQSEAVEETKVEEEVIEPEVDLSAYIPFAEAAKELGVRFQQVYQRAVIRNKMRWEDTGKRKVVHKDDVAEWAKIRVQYFADKAK